jgi:ABC-type nitrate/sulfonate/bicarbonate transport system substrate-binding protein
VDKISFPYRSSSHLPLLHVIAESGSWEKHGLDVNYDYAISSGDAHRLVPTGEVEFVGGNHVSTYGRRARGDSWIYLGQTMNYVYPKLVVRPDSGIESIADLRGKKVGTRGNHPSLNDWLLLKQRGLDSDRDDFEFDKRSKPKKNPSDSNEPLKKVRPTALWELIRDGEIDAALIMPPSSLHAEDAGLKLIDVDPLPMIWLTTLSSSIEFVEKHPDIVDRFLKGVIEGIHFFKTQPEKSIKIIQERYVREGQLNFAQASYTHQIIRDVLEPKLYPLMSAISNVYEEAKRQDKDAERINPMALWDLHFIRRIEDSGFIRNLYGSGNDPAAGHVNDPDYAREKAAMQEKIIAEVKKCGHPMAEDCGCS